jgi:hypothetical protein
MQACYLCCKLKLLYLGRFLKLGREMFIPNNKIRYNASSVEATKHLNTKPGISVLYKNYNTNIEQQIRTRPATIPQNVKKYKPQKRKHHGAIVANNAYSHNINIYTRGSKILRASFHPKINTCHH